MKINNMANKKHYVDYKVSVWLRIETTGKSVFNTASNSHTKPIEIIKNAFEKGHITSPDEIYSSIGLAHGGYLKPEIVLHGSEEFITPEENNNQATIEIYEKSDNPKVSDKLIWTNQTTLSESFENEN